LCEQWRQTGLPVKQRLGFAAFGVAILYAYGYELPIHSFVEGGVLVQGLPQWLAGSGTVLLVNPVDHLVVAHVGVDGCRVCGCSFGLLSIDRSFSIPHINKELMMSTSTVEITLGLQAEFLKVPLATAQTAVLAAYKAAGNDLGALATKAGTLTD
jgi:hypothetical protein